ncbi:DUF2922 domain-containing protein [Eubacterium sp. 1001713B170207_170306_E7]|uniref:DUF2922 domain-containing protein n=1 Tax=Eubacterium sp. 1001713B170207_170306_E7 TaxID=2787097 RepID=UPI00189A5873|nr:DUF2922 domain-containing protein [Eubacterium sp. 1001713B170207_170306_E7]
MADVSKDLQLIYELANGKNHTLTIPDYKEGITDTEIAEGANGILNEGIFEPDGQPLAALVSAVRIDTTKTEVALG